MAPPAPRFISRRTVRWIVGMAIAHIAVTPGAPRASKALSPFFTACRAMPPALSAFAPAVAPPLK